MKTVIRLMPSEHITMNDDEIMFGCRSKSGVRITKNKTPVTSVTNARVPYSSQSHCLGAIR